MADIPTRRATRATTAAKRGLEGDESDKGKTITHDSSGVTVLEAHLKSTVVRRALLYSIANSHSVSPHANDNVSRADHIASKRPALSSTFSSHMNETSLKRQLLTAQAKVTELQNTLNDNRAEIDRLKADRRLLAAAEDNERKEKQRDAKLYSEEKVLPDLTYPSLSYRLHILI